MSESELLADRARFLDASDGVRFRHVDGTTVWPAGAFECATVAELRQRVPAASATPSPTPLLIKVEDGIDIGELQATLTTEQRALVQIASNFNCLEVPSRGARPDHGTLVTRHATDSTQGPAATFGVPAAALLRAHYVFYDAAADAVGPGAPPPSTWGQTAERQVELLSGVREFFGTCVNGKVTLRGDETPFPAGGDDAAAAAERIRIGLHTDAEVVFGRGPSQPGGGGKRLSVLPAGARPLVDQVLSASVNLNSPGEAPRQPEQLRALVRACLFAAYQGAYLAAIVRERKLLLLTLVGGGVFDNPLEDILDAIAEAHAAWAHRSSLVEVRLCLYQRGTAEGVRAALQARLQALQTCKPAA